MTGRKLALSSKKTLYPLNTPSSPFISRSRCSASSSSVPGVRSLSSSLQMMMMMIELTVFREGREGRMNLSSLAFASGAAWARGSTAARRRTRGSCPSGSGLIQGRREERGFPGWSRKRSMLIPAKFELEKSAKKAEVKNFIYWGGELWGQKHKSSFLVNKKKDFLPHVLDAAPRYWIGGTSCAQCFKAAHQLQVFSSYPCKATAL